MAVLSLATSLAALNPPHGLCTGSTGPPGAMGPTKCLDPEVAPGRAGAGVTCPCLGRDSRYRPCDLREV